MICLVLGPAHVPSATGQGQMASPVTNTHLQTINQLLQRERIPGAVATRDARGRVELQGTYRDEREVDRAFSLAQTVVGIRWVSPITPQNVKVKEWEACLSRLLSGERCGPAVGSMSSAALPTASSQLPGGATPPASAGLSTQAASPAETAPGSVASKYALIAGIGRFRNQIQPLQYANKDAFDFYSYLLDPQGGGFRRENVILLRDEHATRDNLKRALDEIRRRAQADDFVLLYFSSHGTPPDKFGGVHLVTFDSEVKPRERIWDSSLTEGLLRDFIQDVKAKRLIVVMDACYSNGAYAQVSGFLPPGGKSLDSGLEEGYGRSRRDMASRLFGAKDLVTEDDAPAATLAAPRPTGWGKVLISASDAGERSWESDVLRNSIFTRYFVEGLRVHGGAVKEAFEYAKARVPAQVRREKGADLTQTPQLTPNRRDWNMSLAVAER